MGESFYLISFLLPGSSAMLEEIAKFVHYARKNKITKSVRYARRNSQVYPLC